MQELYYKALVVAKTQSVLAKNIAKISKQKASSIERYFIRFTFIQVKKAEDMIKCIHQYMDENCLFGRELAL